VKGLTAKLDNRRVTGYKIDGGFHFKFKTLVADDGIGCTRTTTQTRAGKNPQRIVTTEIAFSDDAVEAIRLIVNELNLSPDSFLNKLKEAGVIDDV
jgi:hypothetical protein